MKASAKQRGREAAARHAHSHLRSRPPSQERPAAFLDRDGTICEEVGYLNHISRLQIFPQAARAVRRLNHAGLPVIVVTNQSGVSRGIFPESLVAKVHARMKKELAGYGAHLDDYYYCTHTKADNCECRKPLPGQLLQAAGEHSLDLSRSFVVGDRHADVELAHAAGGRGILVLTGYGRGEYELHHEEWERQPDYVAKDLSGAVTFILGHLAQDEKSTGRVAKRAGRKKNRRRAGNKTRP